MYDFHKAESFGLGYDKPLEYCDDIGGFSAKSWGESITPWAKESIKYYNRACKTGKN